MKGLIIMAKVTKAPKTGITRKRIDNDAFVDAWLECYQNGGTQQDVAAAVGCSLGGVYVKAKSLAEKHGVDLPKLASTRASKVDADSLNARIAKATKGKATAK